MRITAILASHNRRERTLACLASYYRQEVPADVLLTAVLVDDGSTDGTAKAVRSRFTATTVVPGDGRLFWAGAMERAEGVAMTRATDYLLWLNDDVVLDPDALSRLIGVASERDDGCIVVGAVRDPVSGAVTYSGVRRRGFHPLRVDLVEPSGHPAEVYTFNGNAVLVPQSVSAKVGRIDGAFVHAAADFDYGLRAAVVGVTSVLAPGTVGTCRRGERLEPWRDRSLSPVNRLRLFLGPKGFPPRARARYLMRHGGAVWPLFWVVPYVRAAISLVRPASPSGVQ